MRQCRLCCPEHGVRSEAVTFVRAGRLRPVPWRTVSAPCARVSAETLLGTERLSGLVDIGVDEIPRHDGASTVVRDRGEQ